jgi:hypothetical protein
MRELAMRVRYLLQGSETINGNTFWKKMQIFVKVISVEYKIQGGSEKRLSRFLFDSDS